MLKKIKYGVSTFSLILLFLFPISCANKNYNKTTLTDIKIIKDSMKYNKLNPEETAVIIQKATEKPFTGKLLENKKQGIYICKQCDAPLYLSKDKFESHCGWPSFDDEIEGAVKRVPDADGRRTEIICANCGGHLGHVFIGEGFTLKNTRHCVNSISMKFISAEEQSLKNDMDTAYFASGCFWGTEYHFMKADGVKSTTVGYMGGKTENPSYKEVCTGTTGHVETTEIIFNTSKTDFETLAKLFFETHDFTQTDGQGPDIGSQYLSVIFYKNERQKEIAEKLIKKLSEKGYRVATQLKSANEITFWNAEDYHQEYYENKNGTPYCHAYKKIF